jgi:hypothetical protein
MHLDMINKVTTGVFKKFGYFVSEILLNRSINKTGSIVLLGNNKSAFKFKRFFRPLSKRIRNIDYRYYIPALLKEKEKRRTAPRRPKIYLFAYIDQIIKKYLNFNYQFSFRKLNKSFSNADMFSSYLTNNKASVLRMIKRSIRYMRKEKYRRIKTVVRRRKSHKFFKHYYLQLPAIPSRFPSRSFTSSK